MKQFSLGAQLLDIKDRFPVVPYGFHEKCLSAHGRALCRM